MLIQAFWILLGCKKYADQYEPSTQTTNFMQLFGYFGTFKIPYKQSEFHINGGFTGVMTEKFQKISTADSTFGTGKFAADYDEEGDAKLRQQHIVQRVFSDLLFFVKNKMLEKLCMQRKRSSLCFLLFVAICFRNVIFQYLCFAVLLNDVKLDAFGVSICVFASSIFLTLPTSGIVDTTNGRDCNFVCIG